MKNLKIELIALVVRLLADQTTLVRRPSGFEALIDDLFNVESYDVRVARTISAEATRAVEAAKRFSTNRKFKKIVQNV